MSNLVLYKRLKCERRQSAHERFRCYISDDLQPFAETKGFEHEVLIGEGKFLSQADILTFHVSAQGVTQHGRQMRYCLHRSRLARSC